MILESALLIRWAISFVVMILLLIAFYVGLRILKQKGILNAEATKVLKDNRMKLIDQFYIDSKNKIVKIKDNDEVLTILVGSNASLIKQQKIKKSDKEEK